MRRMKKIKNAFASVIGGLICIVIGIVLLWWNEGNDVKNIKTIEEARESLVNVKSDEVDPANEGKLVSTNGTIKVIDESLKDAYFNIVVPNTGKLVRIVEMYQWVEDCDTEDDRTVCTYEKKWLTTIENSDSFEESGHDNPSDMPYDDEAYYANRVELGAFKLSATQIQMLSTEATVTPNATASLPNGYTIIDEYITSASSMSNPKVGDVRVSFKYNTDTEITVLAMQKGDSFADFESEQGKILNELKSGLLTGEEMIDVVETENNIFKWVLRILGVALVTGGFTALLTPILMVVSIIPLIGDGIAWVLRAIAGLIGFAVSMLIIALAWIVFRPLLGICLLAVVVGVVVLVVVLIKKGRAKAALNQQQQVAQGVVPQAVVGQQVINQQQIMMQQTPVQTVMPQQPVQPAMPQQPVQPQVVPQQVVQPQVVPQQVVQPQVVPQQVPVQQQVVGQVPVDQVGQNNNQQ